MRMSRTRHAIAKVKRVWAEMEYAQRRLFEIRTGVAATGPRRPRRACGDIARLDAL